ncbi:MAG: ABC transporter permease [Candidatus Magasanikbacteria bacterium]|nr:ABC transporter permease [Candidatus Magasanikbacteria bacterium]
MNGALRQVTHNISFIDLLRLSVRIFKTKPLRTFLTILGMSVGIGTVLFLISLGYGLQYILIGKLVATEDSLITMEAFYPSESGLNITKETAEQILALPETGEISLVAEFPGEIRYGDSSGFTLIRMAKPNYFRLSGVVPDIGFAYREDEAGAVLSSQAVKLTELIPDASTLDKSFFFKVFYQKENEVNVEEVEFQKPLNLKGVITDEVQPPFALLPYGFSAKDPPFYKRILVKARDINLIEGLRDKLIAKGFVISARIDLVNQAKKVMNIITVVLGVFGIAALIVSAIGMFNTMIIGFLERIYEVGIMKSLGATDRDIRNLFLTESLMMGFLGGVGGVVFGTGLGQIANLSLNLLARQFGGKPFTLFITPTWFILVILVSSAFIGIVSGFWPAERATYLSPKEAFVKK